MRELIEITDFHAPELDIYARLTETQLRSAHGIENSLFIAESPNVIERALDGGCVPESLVMLPKMLEGREAGIPIMERCGDIPVYVAKEDCLKQLTGFPLTRGVLCAMRRPPVPKAEDLLKDSSRVVVLEDVMNPTNLGAIFRSAAAMGMDAILLTPASTDPLYRRCIRVSMGTVFQIPWAWIGEELSDCPGRNGPAACVKLARDGNGSPAGIRLPDSGDGAAGRVRQHRRPRPGSGGKTGRDPRNGGGRTCRKNHRGLRLHGENPHGARCRLPECGSGRRGCLLAAGKALKTEQNQTGLPASNKKRGGRFSDGNSVL